MRKKEPLSFAVTRGDVALQKITKNILRKEGVTNFLRDFQKCW